MRYLYISFFLWLVAGNVLAQSKVDSAAVKGNPGAPRIVLRCKVTAHDEHPLWIVDGVVVDTGYVRRVIDPGDIESLTILKDSTATTLYGVRALYGVIIITTKTAKLKQFLIKDLLEGNGVSGATLTFISLKNKKDSLRFAADEQGLVRTALLKPGEEYKLMISSIGYKTLSEIYKNTSSSTNQFLLERDVKENQPVVVVGYGGYSCRYRTCCGSSIYKIWSASVDSIASASLSTSIYPNPLLRGGVIKVEINVQKEKSPLKVRITNLNGSALRSVSYHPFKGINRVEVPTQSQWAAGIYFVQILDEKGKLLKQDKLLLQ